MKLTQQDIDYLKAGAGERGYKADDLLRAINYESSGRPDVWGGKGKNYFGLIQFGPSERKQFGVDTVHPSARNQIDAMFGFLQQRGFKPGMGLLDLYSTINAGSPGHYKASDGHGTVASHVAKMIGMPVATASGQSAPAMSLSGGVSFMDDDTPAARGNIDELLAMDRPEKRPDPIGSLLSELAQPEQPQPSEDAFLQQMRDAHRARHLQAVQGLL